MIQCTVYTYRGYCVYSVYSVAWHQYYVLVSVGYGICIDPIPRFVCVVSAGRCTYMTESRMSPSATQ